MNIKDLYIRKIIKLHNQQSPTWRLISTTPMLLYMMDSKPSWIDKFLIFIFILEDQLKLSKNSVSTWLLPLLTCLQDSS